MVKAIIHNINGIKKREVLKVINIKTARERIYYSPETTAKEMGVKTDIILAWESGKNIPIPEQLSKLAYILLETEDYLSGKINIRQNPKIWFHAINDPWHKDQIEDYNNAKTDEDRKKILMSFGVDRDHFYAYRYLYL